MTDTSQPPPVRRAGMADAAPLTALLRSLGTFPRLAHEPEAATAERLTRQLEACLQDASHSLYLAEGDASEPCGYAAVHWLPYLFLDGPEGFVSELFVHPEARGRGLGRALLAAVEAEAVDRGCARLQLVNFRDRESYRRGFYAKAGWEERAAAASFVKRLA